MECWELLADVLKSKQGWWVVNGWSDIAAIAQAGAAIIVAVGTIIGLSKWRNDIAWKRKLEVAERTLMLFYRAREVIKSSRDFEISPDETSEDTNRDDRDLQGLFSQKYTQTPLNKLNKENELFAEIKTIRFLFIFHLNNSSEKPFQELTEIVDQIKEGSAGLKSLPALKNIEVNDKLRHLINKWKDGFYQKRENDPINKRLDEAIAQIEATCRPYLK